MVADIRSSVIGGNSVYYVQLEGGDVYYSICASDSPEAAILNPGDRISLTASGAEGPIIPASGLSIK